MRHAYYLYLYQSPLSEEELRTQLEEVFPQVLSFYQDMGVHTHIQVERSSEDYELTPGQENLIQQLGAKGHFAPYWEPGELEALRKRREEEEEQAYREKIAQALTRGAHYFVCEFTQSQMPGFEGTIYVRLVQPEPYTSKKQADYMARDRERALHRLHDYNVVVYAQLAENYEAASQGIFLDE